MKIKKGFTLVEVLVAISIIGILSGVAYVGFSDSRIKAKDSAAMNTGMSLVGIISQCSVNGGKINKPSAGGGNNICNLGDSYGKYPASPDGWTWDTENLWIGNGENLMLMRSSYDANRRMYCGIYPPWSSSCDSSNPGLCRGAQGYTCTMTTDNGVTWK